MTQTTDRQARISADIILLILLALAFGPALSVIRLPTRAAAEVRPTVAPAIIIVATPALPTIAPTTLPTDAPAVIAPPVPTAEPIIVYVPVEVPAAPVVEAPVEMPVAIEPPAEAREVAPGIEHGSRPSQRGPNTAGPGMPAPTPQP